MPATGDFSEYELLDALRTFLLTVVRPGTEIIKAQGNRVPEPRGDSFVVMTPTHQRPLAYTSGDYTSAVNDVVLTGSIAQGSAVFVGSIAPSTRSPGYSILSVTSVLSGVLAPGGALSGPGVMAGTSIVSQVAINTGGVGLYLVDVPQTVASAQLREDYGILTVVPPFGFLGALIEVGDTLLSEMYPDAVAAGTYVTGVGPPNTYYLSISQTVPRQTLTAGRASYLQPAEYTVQLDVHGPCSGDDARAIMTLLRSDAGVEGVGNASGFRAVPLYTGDANQMPFVNAEQQYEYRWVVETVLQVNSSVNASQQYAAKVAVALSLANPPPRRA